MPDFSKLGYRKQIMYTSSSNTRTNQVAGFVDEEKEKMEVASATIAMSIDPVCEKYYWISPYAYCLNNPVRFIEPDGQQIVGLTKEDANKVLQDRRYAIVSF
jgi:hypothetical protein